MNVRLDRLLHAPRSRSRPLTLALMSPACGSFCGSLWLDFSARFLPMGECFMLCGSVALVVFASVSKSVSPFGELSPCGRLFGVASVSCPPPSRL
jgi:hypothetical protein